MSKEKKSIIEEALLEAETIDKTFKDNAKEILTKTMSSDIEEMVKESLKKDYKKKALKEEEDDDENEATELEVSDETESSDLEDDSMDIESEDETETDDELESELTTTVGDNEEDMDDETMDLELSTDDDSEELSGMEMGSDEMSLDMDTELGDVETIDLTGAADDEVITVFKKMSPNDEIEVVKTGDTIEVKDNQTGAEYKIEMNSPSVEEEMTDEEEVVYEIEVDDDEEMTEEEITMEEEEGVDEAARTKSGVGNFRTGNRTNDIAKDRMGLKMESGQPKFSKLVKENEQLKRELNISKKEVTELKESNENFVSALKELRNKLHEIALFNSNLTYATRIFTEHSTTKQEKLNIIERFDSCNSLKESKNIYKQIVNEISNTKSTVKETVDEKITKTPKSGANVINEQSVYSHPEIDKMKKLWSYKYKK